MVDKRIADSRILASWDPWKRRSLRILRRAGPLIAAVILSAWFFSRFQRDLQELILQRPWILSWVSAGLLSLLVISLAHALVGQVRFKRKGDVVDKGAAFFAAWMLCFCIIVAAEIALSFMDAFKLL